MSVDDEKFLKKMKTDIVKHAFFVQYMFVQIHVQSELVFFKKKDFISTSFQTCCELKGKAQKKKSYKNNI